MGMFDWYIPSASLRCPVCGAVLHEWQGKQADNLLLVWREGSAAPTEQWADEEWRLDAESIARRRLPGTFEIHEMDENDHWISAVGHTRAGVWNGTQIQEVSAWRDAAPGATERVVLWRAQTEDPGNA